MIYLHHRPTAVLLPNRTQSRLTQDDRTALGAHRLAVLSLACRAHNLPAPVIMRSNHGKPVCANAPLHFNHSHSQKNYALAFGFDAQTPLKNTQFYNAKPDLGANLGAGVGVDVEDLDRAVNFSALANSRFSDDERKRWQANGTAAAWFAIWCAKEAVLKAHGLGIRLNLRELNTHAAADDMAGFAQHARIGRFYYRCFSVNHAMLAVAHRDEKTLWDLVWV